MLKFQFEEYSDSLSGGLNHTRYSKHIISISAQQHSSEITFFRRKNN